MIKDTSEFVSSGSDGLLRAETSPERAIEITEGTVAVQEGFGSEA